jgi:hypothetical protein
MERKLQGECLLLAQMRSADRMDYCPSSREDRTYRGQGSSVAIDPKRS